MTTVESAAGRATVVQRSISSPVLSPEDNIGLVIRRNGVDEAITIGW
ncbi:hypothetical protein [Nocardia niwae]|uniref:Uncharacterized protein n=1 Tax=Nocardia niwae TaxID=626084 RepID=A0ABV2X5M0_9NOCA|nr:hypothetical protein [Nocardia niwae]